MGGSGKICREATPGGGGRWETPVSRRTCLDEGRDGGGGRTVGLTLPWCAGESTLRGGGPTDEVLARGGGPAGTLSLRGGGTDGVLETAGNGGGSGDA